MPARLRPPAATPPALTRASAPAAGDPALRAAPAGLCLGSAVVWHFINPEQIPLDGPLAIAAAVAAAGLVAFGVFQGLGPARAPQEPTRGADDEAAARLADQLGDQLRQGRAVSWAGPV